MKDFKVLEKYFSKHVWYAQFIHLVLGVGLGILLTYPLVGEHPLRWGGALVALGLLGHLAPWVKNK